MFGQHSLDSIDYKKANKNIYVISNKNYKDNIDKAYVNIKVVLQAFGFKPNIEKNNINTNNVNQLQNN